MHVMTRLHEGDVEAVYLSEDHQTFIDKMWDDWFSQVDAEYLQEQFSIDGKYMLSVSYLKKLHKIQEDGWGGLYFMDDEGHGFEIWLDVENLDGDESKEW